MAAAGSGASSEAGGGEGGIVACLLLGFGLVLLFVLCVGLCAHLPNHGPAAMTCAENGQTIAPREQNENQKRKTDPIGLKFLRLHKKKETPMCQN